MSAALKNAIEIFLRQSIITAAHEKRETKIIRNKKK